MRRLSQLRDAPGQDRGAALVLVLIIVTVIGLSGAATLTFSDTSIRTTVALRDQAGNAYGADGAAKVAINSLKNGFGYASPAMFVNADNTTCFGSNITSGTRNLRDYYPAARGLSGSTPSSASVVCTADPETGVNGTVVPINDTNRPRQAILTLPGLSGEDGVNIQGLSGNPLTVKGTVRSNSNINVVSGTLKSTAASGPAVTAVGTCSGTIVSTPSASCDAPANAVADPNYLADATAVPAYRPVPANVPASCPSGVVRFLPGYYDNATELTALMTGSGQPCSGSTWWFTPGTYYFDFHNNTDDPDVYRGSGTGSGGSANRWGITRGRLVAGTPIDSNGNVIASPGASPTFPGSCQNPIRSATAAGVQFVFGGDSQLAFGGWSNAEICGTYHSSKPPIAVYGLKSGTATPRTLSVTGSGANAALKMDPAAPTSPGGFINPTRVVQEDNSSATWVKAPTVPPTPTPTETSTIAVSGYAPPSAIPPGSIVKSASIRVKHGNLPGYVTTVPNKDDVSITFTPKGVTGSPPAPPTTLALDLTKTIESLDLYGVGPSAGTSDFVKYVHDNGFTGADMAYAATLTHLGTESLDSIQIEISYVTPAFRRQAIKMGPDPIINSNCMTMAYTGGSGAGCAVLSTSALPGFSGAFYVQGTTYTPLAAIDLTLNNATQQVLRFGVISRSLWVKQNASFSYAGPVIEIPNNTVGGAGDPIVFLTVFICPATTTSSCSTDPVNPAYPERGPVKALQIKARIEDSTVPSSSTRRVTILGWSNLR